TRPTPLLAHLARVSACGTAGGGVAAAKTESSGGARTVPTDTDTGLDGAATAPWPREHELAPAADRGRSAQMSSDGCSWVFTGTPPERPSERPQASPKGGWGRRPARPPTVVSARIHRWSARVRASDPESLTHWRIGAALPNCCPTKSAPRLRGSGQVLFFSEKHL